MKVPCFPHGSVTQHNKDFWHLDNGTARRLQCVLDDTLRHGSRTLGCVSPFDSQSEVCPDGSRRSVTRSGICLVGLDGPFNQRGPRGSLLRPALWTPERSVLRGDPESIEQDEKLAKRECKQGGCSLAETAE